jgi:outer membrane protein OmpA-like peptidoglycan-associated protein
VRTLRLPFGLTVAAVALAATPACVHYTEYAGDTVTLGFKVPPPPPPKPPPPPPPHPAKRVEVQGDRVLVHEKIQFDEGKSTIRADSNGLLDEIASVIKDPANRIRKVRVEGHASSDGDADVNMALSDARAKSVMAALTGRGVPTAALIAQGFGITQPIADNGTEEGREKNRRVDFVIVEQAPAPPPPKPAPPPKPKGAH